MMARQNLTDPRLDLLVGGLDANLPYKRQLPSQTFHF